MAYTYLIPMTQHSTTIQPIDEDATNEFLNKTQSVVDTRNKRGEALQLLYRPPTSLPQHQTALRAGQPLVIKWAAVITLGIVMPLPFIALDLIFSTLIGVDTNIGSTYVAMMGILHVMVVGLMAVVMIVHARRVLDNLWLNTTFLLWTSLLFTLPVMTAARQWLVPEFMSGLWPPLAHSLQYGFIFIGASVVSLTAFTWLLYQYRKQAETRVRVIIAIVALPYVVVVPYIISDLVKMLTLLQ